MLKKTLAVIFISFFSMMTCFAQTEQSPETVETTETAEVSESAESIIQTSGQEIGNVPELLKEARTIESECDALEAELKEIVNLSAFEKEYSNIMADFSSHSESLLPEKIEKNSNVDDLISIRGKIRLLETQVKGLEKDAIEQFKKLGAIKDTWGEKQKKWQVLKDKPAFSTDRAARNILNETEKMLESAIGKFDDVEATFVGFFKKIDNIKSEIAKNCEKLDSKIDEIRKKLFKKSGTAMLSTRYTDEFDDTAKSDFYTGIAMLENVQEGFFKNNSWVILLQLIVAALLANYFRKSKHETLDELGLDFLYKNYAASGIFLGTLVGLPFLSSSPNAMQLFYLLIVYVTAACLVAAKVKADWQKKSVFMVFGLFIVFRILDIISMPMVYFRLVMSLLAIAGAVFFIRIATPAMWVKKVAADVAQKEDSEASANGEVEEKAVANDLNIWEKLLCRFVGVVMLIAFIAQLTGYVTLANHIFEVTLRGILIALLSWIFSHIAKGFITLIFNSSFLTEKSKIFAEYGHTFASKLTLIANIIIVFFVIAALLSICGVYDNTGLAASGIMSLGFTVHGLNITVGSIIGAIAVFALILFISWLIQKLLETEYYPRKKIDSGVGISINRIINYSLVLIGIAIAFGVLGLSFSSLAVLIGSLGVGIGFGLQNIVNNFASGLILLFERSIKVGDVVVVNGTWGTVKHLGLRATIIQTFANAEMIVPNSDLISGTVNNWTMSNRKTRFSVSVGVAYGTDTKKVKEILLDIAKSHKNVLKDPAPAVVFNEFGESSLNFELRCWVEDINVHWSTQDDVMYEIDKRFKENNIEIPFPQRDLYIKSMPEKK